MRRHRVVGTAALLAALTMLGACTQAMKYTVVYGQGIGPPNLVTGQAVQGARNAIAEAAKSGCKAISIGSGGGAAGEAPSIANVVVLLACPINAPDILAATGGTTPP